MSTRYYQNDLGEIMESDGKVWTRLGTAQQLPTHTQEIDDDIDIQPFVYDIADSSGKTVYTKEQHCVSNYIHKRVTTIPYNQTLFHRLIPIHGTIRVWGDKDKSVYVNGVLEESWGGAAVGQAAAKPIPVNPGDVVTCLNGSPDAGATDLESTFLPYVYPITPIQLYPGGYRLQDHYNNASFDWSIDNDPIRKGVINGAGSIGWGYMFFKVPTALLQGTKIRVGWQGNYDGAPSATTIYWISLHDEEVDETILPATGDVGVGVQQPISRTVESFDTTQTSNTLDVSGFSAAKATIGISVQGGWSINESVWVKSLEILDAGDNVIHDFDILSRTLAEVGISGRSRYGTFN